MKELQKRVDAVLEDVELTAAIEDQKEQDIAGGLKELTDVELFRLIADKGDIVREAQLFIAGASMLLQQRYCA